MSVRTGLICITFSGPSDPPHLLYTELALRHSHCSSCKPHAESTASGEPNLACSVHDIVRPDEIPKKRSWEVDQQKAIQDKQDS